MRIPQKFQIFGQTIDVVFDVAACSDKRAYGFADYTHNKLVLKPNTEEFPRSQTRIEETFVHELVHYVLHELSRVDLNDDELFVENFAAALYQALESFEFEFKGDGNAIDVLYPKCDRCGKVTFHTPRANAPCPFCGYCGDAEIAPGTKWVCTRCKSRWPMEAKSCVKCDEEFGAKNETT